MTDKMTEAHSPLPCPFCGGAVQFRKALWPSDGCVDAIIHAGPTSCGLVQFSDDTVDESIIATWNTRSPSHAALLAENERLRFALEKCAGPFVCYHSDEGPLTWAVHGERFAKEFNIRQQIARDALTPAADAAGR